MLRTMMTEIRNKLNPLEQAGVCLDHVEILVKRDGRQVTADLILYGGLTPVILTSAVR